MSQVTEQSVRFQTALASIKLIQASAVLDLTEDDFDFLTIYKVWIATDRYRARSCVEACVYGTLDSVRYPRVPAPVEFIAAVIAYYVHPVNIQTACLIMEVAECTENIINGFVFQAEDGIRYLTVTGVQTCALPIDACVLEPAPRGPRSGAGAPGGGSASRASCRRGGATRSGRRASSRNRSRRPRARDAWPRVRRRR